MASSNSSLPPPTIFLGENYDLWAAKMGTYLDKKWELYVEIFFLGFHLQNLSMVCKPLSRENH